MTITACPASTALAGQAVILYCKKALDILYVL